MADPLLRYRAEFPILGRPLISSPIPSARCRAASADAMREYTDSGRHAACAPGPRAGGCSRARSAIRSARSWARPRHGVAPPERHAVPGRRRVVLRLQRAPEQGRLHRPELSVGDVFLGGAARARRAHPHGAQRRRRHVNTERLLEAIDEETLLVPISHVIFRSSFIQDAKAIIERAHRVGAQWCSTRSSRSAACRSTCRSAGRLRVRRGVEVAVRRSGHGVSVRAARSRSRRCSRR